LAKDLLAKAEIAYGPRDQQWQFAGVTPVNGGPLILYPNVRVAMIGVSVEPTSDTNQLMFQLAHEVIHLLSPNNAQSDATMIEEGTAVKFSLHGPDYPWADYSNLARSGLSHPNSENYKYALELLEELETTHPSAIRRLRETEPHFYLWTPEFLVAELGITSDFAERLCSRKAMRPREPLAVMFS